MDPKTTGMTARHFLLFCYYGGMIYTGDLHLHLTDILLLNVESPEMAQAAQMT